MGMRISDHRILPHLDDKEEYLYVEKAIIEQDDLSICIVQGNNVLTIPICSLSCLILGPGVSITHRAIQAIAESRCIVVWSGEYFREFYAVGFERNRSSSNILKQIEYYSDKEKHTRVVRRMYEMRFTDMKSDGLTIEQMRGIEGVRMKDIYEKWAKSTGVVWRGRKYDPKDFDAQDVINQYITVGNQLLYNICRAAIYNLGYSPAIGFIHTGHMDSFVYDIADLYKADIVIPTAFKLGSLKGIDHKQMRIDCHKAMKEKGLLKIISKDIFKLFGEENVEDNVEDNAGLWNESGATSAMGVNYADMKG